MQMQVPPFRFSSSIRVALILSLLPLALVGCTAHRQQGDTGAPGPVAAEAGVDNGRGACIGGRQASDSCAFAIGVLDDAKEEPVALLSRKLIDYDDSGQPNWDVQDRVPVPRDHKGLHLEQSSCRFDGTEDETVVALVPAFDEHGPEWVRAQDWAYKVQLPSGKFQSLEPGKVDCRNTAIGAD